MTTVITFCKFQEDGKLAREDLTLGDVSYIAVSHIWANAVWHPSLDGIDWEVLASPHKARFIATELQRLVGSEYFWMDILCVDQRSAAARIGVVKAIPDIYRRAAKTLVIREGGGIRRCCADAVGEFQSWAEEGAQRMGRHVAVAHVGGIVEGWFDRLWPLQELLLSDHLVFSVCELVDEDAETRRKAEDESDPDEAPPWDGGYGGQVSAQRLGDAVDCVARSWVSYGLEDDGSQEDYVAFIRALLCVGNVSRSATNADRSRHDAAFDFRASINSMRIANVNSLRVTSKPRDFILAILPQYGWYMPPANVKGMPFGVLWVDCYEQALQAGCSFIPAITKGMTRGSGKSKAAREDDSNLPSADIPEPTCLGDFMKLFGSWKETPQSVGHPVALVELLEPQMDSWDSTLSLIESSMRFSGLSWNFAFRGELSAHGIFPEIEMIHERMWGGLMKRESRLVTMSENQRARFFELKERYSREMQREGQRRLEPSYYEVETIKTLGAMWAGLFEPLPLARQDWADLKEELLRMDPAFFRETMVRYAALISCDIGIGAFHWSQRYLRPVHVQLGGFDFMALVAQSCETKDAQGAPEQYLCVQRGNKVSGKDLILVDVENQEVVGKLPDFLDRRQSAEWNFERLKQLYPLAM